MVDIILLSSLNPKCPNVTEDLITGSVIMKFSGSVQKLIAIS